LDEVSLLRRFVEIYSPSGQEGEAIGYLIRVMDELGFDARRDDWGNAWGIIGSGEPRVLLCGHVDTVPGYIPVRIEEGILYARGSVDAKASMMAMVMAAHRFSRTRLPGTIIVAGVVGEEAEGAGSGAGVNGILHQNPRMDYAIFGEPTGLNRIAIGYRGRIGLRVTCYSQESHAGSPAPSNSIDGILQALQHLHEYARAQRKPRDEFNSLTLTPTLIRGGTFHNVVPAKCEAFVDIRVPPHMRNEDVIDRVGMIISRLGNPSLMFEFEVVDSTPPYEAPKTSPLIRALIRAILTQTPLKPRLTRKTGTGDMSVLGSRLKIPVATYGPGDARLSHTMHEAIELDEYRKSISVYQQALTYLSEIHNKE
jgi:LysW-gamma-L-lysine carboxypeptidase